MNDSQPATDAAAYPRPMLRRDSFHPLVGDWDFQIGGDRLAAPGDVEFDRTIRVPFAPESPLSGVGHDDFLPLCWYRRRFAAPPREGGERVRLVFEAVDYRCRVWLNGVFVGEHEGGYTRFAFDVTDALSDAGEQTLIVRVQDDPLDLSQPRGKQDWLREPHGIWYPRKTGIWQTPWLEVVPQARVSRLNWTADVTAWQIALDAEFAGDVASLGEDAALRVTLSHDGQRLARDTFTLASASGVDGLSRVLRLADPGIDDARHKLLWSPQSPTLIDASVELLDSAGEVVDRVASYTAMRDVATLGDRFMLNGRPIQLRLVLDQGYWPDGGLTAPDDAALRRDVELIKSLGFNGVRLHQKIECERFLYWADTLGLLVWEELPSAYQFTPRATERLAREWTAAVRRDQSHPCVIAWVPVNESWGFPDLPVSPQQRDGVRALYYLTKTLDPTRPVVSNDGWEMAETDLIAVHDYDWDADKVRQRYDRARRTPAEIFATERPGGRVLLLDSGVYRGQPALMTEFGGIAFSPDAKQTWGYSRATDARDFLRRYAGLLAAVRECPLFAGGFCYTQFTDTYQEANGLLRMDRTPKAEAELLRLATAGPRDASERRRLAEAVGAAS